MNNKRSNASDLSDVSDSSGVSENTSQCNMFENVEKLEPNNNKNLAELMTMMNVAENVDEVTSDEEQGGVLDEDNRSTNTLRFNTTETSRQSSPRHEEESEDDNVHEEVVPEEEEEAEEEEEEGEDEETEEEEEEENELEEQEQEYETEVEGEGEGEEESEEECEEEEFEVITGDVESESADLEEGEEEDDDDDENVDGVAIVDQTSSSDNLAIKTEQIKVAQSEREKGDADPLEELYSAIKQKFKRDPIVNEVRCQLQAKMIAMMKGKNATPDGPLIQRPSANDCVQSDASRDERIATLDKLIMEYFHWNGFPYSAEMFNMESNTPNAKPKREVLEDALGVFQHGDTPILLELVEELMLEHGKDTTGNDSSSSSGSNSSSGFNESGMFTSRSNINFVDSVLAAKLSSSSMSGSSSTCELPSTSLAVSKSNAHPTLPEDVDSTRTTPSATTVCSYTCSHSPQSNSTGPSISSTPPESVLGSIHESPSDLHSESHSSLKLKLKRTSPHSSRASTHLSNIAPPATARPRRLYTDNRSASAQVSPSTSRATSTSRSRLSSRSCSDCSLNLSLTRNSTSYIDINTGQGDSISKTQSESRLVTISECDASDEESTQLVN